MLELFLANYGCPHYYVIVIKLNIGNLCEVKIGNFFGVSWSIHNNVKLRVYIVYNIVYNIPALNISSIYIWT